METRDPRSATDPTPIEDLFDLYLDACIEGTADDPDVFSSRHGIEDEAVRNRLRALYEASTHGAAPPSAPVSPSPVPYARLGDFRLIRPLEAGGMGLVYEAEQESLGRRVALKIVRPELTGSATTAARFEREARLVARLRHPNIVEIHAFGDDQGVRFIAMELLEGESLEGLLRRDEARGQPTPTAQVVRWGAALARALHHAHREGVVHRDMKPSNVFVTKADVPRLLDFGIARDEHAVGTALTQTFAGSPLYAAPEQIMGYDVDGRADVYGLGITLYRALAGRVPFEGGTVDHVIKRVLAEEPLPPRRLNTTVTKDLENVVLKAIEREPRRRYADASAFADDLEAVLDGRPVRARRAGVLTRARKWCKRHPAMAGVAAMAVLGVVAFVTVRALDRRADARASIEQARGLLARYAAGRGRDAPETEEVANLRSTVLDRWQPPETWRRLETLEDAVEARAREREELFWQALDALRRAETLGRPRAEVDDLRAALYMEKLAEAEALRDDEAETFYRRLVRRHDAAGRFGSESGFEAEVTVNVDPPDADLYLFRYRLQSELQPDGEPRFVPVPYREATPPIPYGRVCLRVVRGAGDVPTGAHILELAGHPIRGTFLVDAARAPVHRLDRLVRVGEQDLPPAHQVNADETVDVVFERGDGTRYTVRATGLRALGVTLMTPAEAAEAGGIEARVLVGGAIRALTLPAGLGVRPTAAPFLCWDAARLDARTFRLGKGQYLLIARKPGHEPLRHPLNVHRKEHIIPELRLLPVGTTPDGFVRVPPLGPTPSYWVMEREVNSAEYLAFVQDPETRAVIDASPVPVLYPRGGPNHEGGHWSYRRGAPVEIPARGWDPRWPVLGVSFSDAEAYAAWRTRRAQASGRAVVFALPTHGEWALAATGSFTWRYAHGQRFRAHWVKSCRSHVHAFPEPCMRYPVDESPMGVFDCTGSAAEWIDHWDDKTRNMRLVATGNWGLTEPDRFVIWGAGQPADRITGMQGFRLVMRPK